MEPQERYNLFPKESLLEKRITLKKIIRFLILLLIIAMFAIFFYSNLEYFLKSEIGGPTEKLRTREELGIK
jgi:glucan phosphoethanolaminetransferase (alkaline phosphatase superfamily)